MFKITHLLIILGVLLTSCVEYKEDPLCSEYKQISLEELRSSIVVQAPREIQNAGKIYVYNNLLFVNEINKGIHIINNQDKNNPVPLVFIKIPGSIDIAVKNSYLYVDSFVDLVVLDINDLNNIYELNRVKDIFTYNKYQAISTGKYELTSECNYGDKKGFVIGVKE